MEDLAGDVGGGRQEKNEGRRFLRRIETLQDMAFKRGGAHFFTQSRRHAGFEKPGKDTIDPDVATPELPRVTFCQTDQACLARRVGGLTDRGMERGVGSDVDDMAGPSSHHLNGGGAGAEMGPLQIGVHDLAPGFRAEALQDEVVGDPGVIDKDVDPFKGIKKTFHRPGAANVKILSSRTVNNAAGVAELRSQRRGKFSLSSGDDNNG